MHYRCITVILQKAYLNEKGIKVNLSICEKLNLVGYCHEVTKKLFKFSPEEIHINRICQIETTYFPEGINQYLVDVLTDNALLLSDLLLIFMS